MTSTRAIEALLEILQDDGIATRRRIEACEACWPMKRRLKR
jgi:hypothetical protein